MNCLASLALSALVVTMAGCTLVSRGTIVVEEVAAASPATTTEDDVARIVGTVVTRHGLRENQQFAGHEGEPCTMERGCIWNPAPSEFPWVSVFRASDGRVHVDVEVRGERHDARVETISAEIERDLRVRFGNQRVKRGRQ